MAQTIPTRRYQDMKAINRNEPDLADAIYHAVERLGWQRSYWATPDQSWTGITVTMTETGAIVERENMRMTFTRTSRYMFRDPGTAYWLVSSDQI